MKKIKLKDSSSILAAFYDLKAQELIVEFTKGGIYKYFNVDVGTIAGWQKAESVGSWFCKHIRGNYICERIHLGQVIKSVS